MKKKVKVSKDRKCPYTCRICGIGLSKDYKLGKQKKITSTLKGLDGKEIKTTTKYRNVYCKNCF